MPMCVSVKLSRCLVAEKNKNQKGWKMEGEFLELNTGIFIVCGLNN